MKLKEYTQKNSVKKLADESGITVFAVYNYIKGARSPTPAIARAIVKATGGKVSLNDLYGQEDGKK